MNRAFCVSLLASALTLVAVPAAAAPASDDLSAVRAATAQYHDPAVAMADGYLPTEDCVASPAGAMGQHWINPAHIGSSDPTTPQALIYQPYGDGLRLVAVEYIIFAPDKAPVSGTNIDPDGPMRFGQHYQGPMAGHFPGMPVHYDLHVWLWQHNPNGTFAQWNPAGHC